MVELAGSELCRSRAYLCEKSQLSISE
jgi:hypothetical protein